MELQVNVLAVCRSSVSPLRGGDFSSPRPARLAGGFVRPGLDLP